MLHYNKHANLNERLSTPVTNYKAVSHYRACLTMQGRAVLSDTRIIYKQALSLKVIFACYSSQYT